MQNWFTCKVKYQKEDENGRVKNVTETYLADALSFTEAEAKIYDEIGQRVMGEFQVTSIAKSKIVDVFEYPEGDVFYQAKVSYMVGDADTGKEKKVTNLMIVHAPDIRVAWDRIHESLNNMLVTFVVPEIKESPILEVFHHVKSDEEKIPDNLTPVSELESDEQDV
ncbi:DUF4494 domain-containing protein [Roseivirga misakiensis]|uniref:Uncharacterized protein n=1 Tax=Roseivirga misakiensis TaxID=1563681 RepID=A0A1E5SKQ8_9BACT|nr:DUF4494 domain-containing protein [Roseivirga misakiensis]OEJ99707.1 hypothetical protein BFP71_09055 [Roseivirga misakiensis]